MRVYLVKMCVYPGPEINSYLLSHTCSKWVYWYAAYMAPTWHLPSYPGIYPWYPWFMVHGSILQPQAAKAAKVHWLILIRLNGGQRVLLDISTLKIPISSDSTTFHAVSPIESIFLNCSGTRFEQMGTWWIYKQIRSNWANNHPISYHIISPMDWRKDGLEKLTR